MDTTCIDDLLVTVWETNATDLLLIAGSPPRARVDGALRPIAGRPALTPADIELITTSLLGADGRQTVGVEHEVDFSFGWRDVARLRGNCFVQQGSLAIALRVIPEHIPTFAELGLPPVLGQLAMLPQGFVLVTGPTGSGKSTTLAAMLDYVNERREAHIVTIEDPIEYVHRHKRSAISQREVGVDTGSFQRALRSALREDPDVILVGEMRDLETIQFALTLAETGHLVLATLHTNDVAQAIDRISDVFPSDRQEQVRVQLAACLAAVVSQRLVPRVGGGQVAAFEILVANTAVRNLIREGKTHQIRNVLLTGKVDGMRTLETSLSELVTAGLVDHAVAVARSLNPDEIAPPPRRTEPAELPPPPVAV